jgi:hypothetical protein
MLQTTPLPFLFKRLKSIPLCKCPIFYHPSANQVWPCLASEIKVEWAQVAWLESIHPLVDTWSLQIILH